MADLRISRRAVRDLEQIGTHGRAEFGPAVSAEHLHALGQIFELLQEHPLAGQVRPGWGDRLRRFSCPPHRVLYRATRNAVLIVRIVHVSRDVRWALRTGT